MTLLRPSVSPSVRGIVANNCVLDEMVFWIHLQPKFANTIITGTFESKTIDNIVSSNKPKASMPFPVSTIANRILVNTFTIYQTYMHQD